MAEILTEQDLDSINMALERLDELDEDIARAEQAGIDMSIQKQRAATNRQRLRQLRQAFFPGSAGI